MGVNIKIPSLEENRATSLTDFSKFHFLANTITKYLISQKGNFIVNDPVSFMLKMGDNLLKVADSFFDIAKLKKDSNSACVLFRVQADYLATILLIFEGKSEEEIKFRYLLYLIDGLSQRDESLKEIPEYDGSISSNDYDALKTQMTSAKENARNTLDYCYAEIHKHPYKEINPALFDKIVNNKQWKYKEFNDTISKYEFFRWNELYYLIDNRPEIASFISLCSHYVHGNVNSLLLNNDDDDIFDPIVNFNSLLIERYLQMLNSLYGKEQINKILKFCLLRN